ncbi:TetR/AcrR family transcriptional regulator [Bradyrhizobium sp.]|uniref:TetR/AcrR family transcriptional regulator n=1 Tax=Bradyrhizobium sp. TaxID=376 RepID=UPI0025B8B0FA|nr:TetR/AcrR family transcriptional regulator [Bradyrhizobium sp.]
MLVKSKKSEQARTALLEAARAVLRSKGYSGLSTRDVAVAAKMPLSQIHYHFGSKEGLVLALFDYLNEQLLGRQAEMFGNPDLRLSEQWKLACDYLDEDLASGYVIVLQELWVAGYANPEIAAVVRRGILGWQELLTRLVIKSRAGLGPLGSLPAPQISALIGAAFIGGEAYILLGLESKAVPVRKALRAVGDLIAALEQTQTMR